jgi:hypothetical protein
VNFGIDLEARENHLHRPPNRGQCMIVDVPLSIIKVNRQNFLDDLVAPLMTIADEIGPPANIRHSDQTFREELMRLQFVIRTKNWRLGCRLEQVCPSSPSP